MTAPSAGALEACLALLIEQMDMLRDDFVSYSDGKPTAPFVVLREALIAALNAYDEARPALLAALRLREGCQAQVESLRHKSQTIMNGDMRVAYKSAADDLARVLEEPK